MLVSKPIFFIKQHQEFPDQSPDTPIKSNQQKDKVFADAEF
jgi:hypothetical protein